MKIRMHKGGFQESMETCADIDPTLMAINMYLYEYEEEVLRLVELKVELDFPIADVRNGWTHTYAVKRGNAIVAFTDGPLVDAEVAHDASH